jgi:hypothetical protein
VIVFDDEDLSNLNFTIPTHATPPPNFLSSKAEGYLKNHFKRCLHVHLCGGDIRSQYTKGMVLNLMEELGIGHDCEDVPVAPLDDNRWNSELGRVLLQAFIEGEVAIKRWEPSNRAGTPVSESSDAESDSSP